MSTRIRLFVIAAASGILLAACGGQEGVPGSLRSFVKSEEASPTCQSPWGVDWVEALGVNAWVACHSCITGFVDLGHGTEPYTVVPAGAPFVGTATGWATGGNTAGQRTHRIEDFEDSLDQLLIEWEVDGVGVLSIDGSAGQALRLAMNPNVREVGDLYAGSEPYAFPEDNGQGLPTELEGYPLRVWTPILRAPLEPGFHTVDVYWTNLGPTPIKNSVFLDDPGKEGGMPVFPDLIPGERIRLDHTAVCVPEKSGYPCF